MTESEIEEENNITTEKGKRGRPRKADSSIELLIKQNAEQLKMLNELVSALRCTNERVLNVEQKINETEKVRNAKNTNESLAPILRELVNLQSSAQYSQVATSLKVLNGTEDRQKIPSACLVYFVIMRFIRQHAAKILRHILLELQNLRNLSGVLNVYEKVIWPQIVVHKFCVITVRVTILF